VEGISAQFQPHYNVKNYDENSNISPCRNIILKKNPLKKETQNPSKYYYNTRTNLKFQHKANISCFKNPHIIKIDLLLLLLLLLLSRGQDPFKLL
jgi:hypothetical protein